MKAGLTSTLAATLIASAVGTGIWLTGFAKALWPAHPLLAVIFFTVIVSVAVRQSWPPSKASRPSSQKAVPRT